MDKIIHFNVKKDFLFSRNRSLINFKEILFLIAIITSLLFGIGYLIESLFNSSIGIIEPLDQSILKFRYIKVGFFYFSIFFMILVFPLLTNRIIRIYSRERSKDIKYLSFKDELKLFLLILIIANFFVCTSIFVAFIDKKLFFTPIDEKLSSIPILGKFCSPAFLMSLSLSSTGFIIMYYLYSPFIENKNKDNNKTKVIKHFTAFATTLVWSMLSLASIWPILKRITNSSVKSSLTALLLSIISVVAIIYTFTRLFQSGLFIPKYASHTYILKKPHISRSDKCKIKLSFLAFFFYIISIGLLHETIFFAIIAYFVPSTLTLSLVMWRVNLRLKYTRYPNAMIFLPIVFLIWFYGLISYAFGVYPYIQYSKGGGLPTIRFTTISINVPDPDIINSIIKNQIKNQQFYVIYRSRNYIYISDGKCKEKGNNCIENASFKWFRRIKIIRVPITGKEIFVINAKSSNKSSSY